MLKLFAVEPDQRNSSTDHLVPDVEFLEILTFGDRTAKKTFSFCISELENDVGSYYTTRKVCKKTAHLSVKNSPKYHAMFKDRMIMINF